MRQEARRCGGRGGERPGGRAARPGRREGSRRESRRRGADARRNRRRRRKVHRGAQGADPAGSDRAGQGLPVHAAQAAVRHEDAAAERGEEEGRVRHGRGGRGAGEQDDQVLPGPSGRAGYDGGDVRGAPAGRRARARRLPGERLDQQVRRTGDRLKGQGRPRGAQETVQRDRLQRHREREGAPAGDGARVAHPRQDGRGQDGRGGQEGDRRAVCAGEGPQGRRAEDEVRGAREGEVGLPVEG